LSATCFHVELEQFLACFRVAQGLSATAGLSCYLVIVFCFTFAFHSKLKLTSSTNPSDHRMFVSTGRRLQWPDYKHNHRNYCFTSFRFNFLVPVIRTATVSWP